MTEQKILNFIGGAMGIIGVLIGALVDRLLTPWYAILIAIIIVMVFSYFFVRIITKPRQHGRSDMSVQDGGGGKINIKIDKCDEEALKVILNCFLKTDDRGIVIEITSKKDATSG
jgi:membrane protein implicated in regulation of membrane protease activity